MRMAKYDVQITCVLKNREVATSILKLQINQMLSFKRKPKYPIETFEDCVQFILSSSNEYCFCVSEGDTLFFKNTFHAPAGYDETIYNMFTSIQDCFVSGSLDITLKSFGNYSIFSDLLRNLSLRK